MLACSECGALCMHPAGLMIQGIAMHHPTTQCFANAETLTGEEQEALDGRQGSSPAVSNLSCNCLGLYLPVL